MVVANVVRHDLNIAVTVAIEDIVYVAEASTLAAAMPVIAPVAVAVAVVVCCCYFACN